MPVPTPDYRLYLVLDPKLCAQTGIVQTALAAAQAGAGIIQLRAPYWKKRELYECAIELKTALAPFKIPLIIDDHVDVAVASGADGVHIGQQDLPATCARVMLGPDKLVGLSINTIEQMKNVDPRIVDYVGVGPIFSTATKPDAAAPIGFDGLAQLMKICPVPAVAIGGLKANHVKEIFKAGADGLAVISAICGQKDPNVAAQTLFKECPDTRLTR